MFIFKYDILYLLFMLKHIVNPLILLWVYFIDIKRLDNLLINLRCFSNKDELLLRILLDHLFFTWHYYVCLNSWELFWRKQPSFAINVVFEIELRRFRQAAKEALKRLTFKVRLFKFDYCWHFLSFSIDLSFIFTKQISCFSFRIQRKNSLKLKLWEINQRLSSWRVRCNWH